MAKQVTPAASPSKTPETAAPEGGETVLSIKDVVTQLVKVSKGKGMVTYDQLNAILPDAVNDPEQLDQILELLEQRNIELVEDLTEAAEGTFGEEVVAETEEGEGGLIYEGVNPLAEYEDV